MNNMQTIKKLLILSLILLMAFICADTVSAAWHAETVDDNGNVGYYPSLILDNQDHPHISYSEKDPNNLKYADWDGATWNLNSFPMSPSLYGTSAALNSDNLIRISYQYDNQKDLWVLRANPQGDSASQVDGIYGQDIGKYSSLAIDSSNQCHICYTRMGGLGYYKGPGYFGSGTKENIGSYIDVRYTSLALDSNEYPHISFYNGLGSGLGELMYVYWDGTIWHTETVDNTAPDVGWYTSLELDSNNYPHISYQDATNQALKYADWNGIQWILETVDNTAPDVGWYTSLELDSNNYPHISYQDATNQALKYAYWNGSQWILETVIDTVDVQYTSLALDSNDDPHIAYFDSTNTALTYLSWMKTVTNINTMETFYTIQDAIDSANTLNGHTIEAGAATYNENVLVNKALTIVGESITNTFIDSFTINTTGAGSDISGFTFNGTALNAVTLQDTEDCVVHDNNISGTYDNGIALYNSNGNFIYSNTIDGTAGINNGVYLENCVDDNWIGDFEDLGNTISYCRNGVKLNNSTFTIIIFNEIFNNLENGVLVENCTGSEEIINILAYNEIYNNGNSDAYWGGVTVLNSNGTGLIYNNIYDNYWHGVKLENSDLSFILENSIYGNGYGGPYAPNGDGISISTSDDAFIFDNDIHDNGWSGVSIFDSANTQIGANNIRSNGNDGVYAYQGTGFNIGDNEIYYNCNGIALVFCNDFDIAENDIQENNNDFWGTDGIEIDGSNDFTIINNTIAKNPFDGINIEDCSDFEISENTIYENDIGVDIWTSDNFQVNSNQIYQNQNGMEIWGSNNAVIDPNIIHDNVNNGVLVNETDILDILDNEIYNNGLNGVELTDCNDIDINNNQVYGNQNFGIILYNCTAVDLDKNEVYSNLNGVKVEQSNDVDLTNNKIYSNTDDGIFIPDSTDVYIFQNDIYSNSWGVLVYGTSTDLVMNFNRMMNNTTYGLDFICTGTMDATLNWWGCNGAENVAKRIFDLGEGNLTYNPYIVLFLTRTPNSLYAGETSAITSDLLHDNLGVYHDPVNGVVPYAGYANFQTNLGTLEDAKFTDGSATSTLTGLNKAGTATVSTTVDGKTVYGLVLVKPITTIAEIITAAGKVKTFYDTQNRLPSAVWVGNTQVTMPQFLKLLVIATLNINLNNLDPIPVTNVADPTAPGGTYTPGTLQKNHYLSVAQNIKTFIHNELRAPNYASSHLGNIPFARLVYLYSKIINHYGLYNKLPSSTYI